MRLLVALIAIASLSGCIDAQAGSASAPALTESHSLQLADFVEPDSAYLIVIDAPEDAWMDVQFDLTLTGATPGTAHWHALHWEADGAYLKAITDGQEPAVQEWRTGGWFIGRNGGDDTFVRVAGNDVAQDPRRLSTWGAGWSGAQHADTVSAGKAVVLEFGTCGWSKEQLQGDASAVHVGTNSTAVTVEVLPAAPARCGNGFPADTTVAGVDVMPTASLELDATYGAHLVVDGDVDGKGTWILPDGNVPLDSVPTDGRFGHWTPERGAMGYDIQDVGSGEPFWLLIGV